WPGVPVDHRAFRRGIPATLQRARRQELMPPLWVMMVAGCLIVRFGQRLLGEQMFALEGGVAAHGLEEAAQHVAGRLDVYVGFRGAPRVQGFDQLLGETLSLAMLEAQSVERCVDLRVSLEPL